MSVLVIPKAPFPSFTLALSRQNVQLKEDDLDESVQLPARGAEVDLMTYAADEDRSDTETIFEVRPERTKLRRDVMQCKGLIYLPKLIAILRVLTCFCGKSGNSRKKHE
ncbi:hypothetical protein CVT25_000440 [Psilocybe cyanescens]|uniref:Uncharacterized protein n=1 Tax=Psilocybe cyanescens TaxID=93625 RepID=A0A409XLX3_PSICY|nr:hypothetical protein CVT25_000440 [Psilocybe cyanescens]